MKCLNKMSHLNLVGLMLAFAATGEPRGNLTFSNISPSRVTGTVVPVWEGGRDVQGGTEGLMGGSRIFSAKMVPQTWGRTFMPCTLLLELILCHLGLFSHEEFDELNVQYFRVDCF